MDLAELRTLLTTDALQLLADIPPYESKADVVKLVADLRKQGHSRELVSTVLTQSRLRSRAEAKFGDFAGEMLFTEAGLEQATRLQVAALHAGRFRVAGIERVADLGCGLGADALAMSALGIEVTAVERDEVTASLAAYNLAAFDQTVVVHADATEVDLSAVDGVFLDPARRTTGHSNTSRVSSEDYSPSLDFAFGLAAQMPAGIKLGPGLDRDLIPADCEAQWISVNGDLVEMGLWFGPLARPDIARSALLLDANGMHEMTGSSDAPDEAVGPLERYLYEPDGAVIRARLIGDLARELDAHPIANEIAYLSAAELTATPFARAFEVEAVLPLDVKTLAAELKARNIGTLEIKKRGVDIDPAEFRKKLKLSGSASAVLFLTRVGEERKAILANRA
jgi:SAM-dependent methyltransferase